MKDFIKQALHESIQHWKDNAAATIVQDTSIGPEHCALCELFFANDCVGCPVSIRTGLAECKGTPYTIAALARFDWRHYGLRSDEFRVAAQQEVAFLESLLPEEDYHG